MGHPCVSGLGRGEVVNWGSVRLSQSQHILGSSFWLMSEEEPEQVQVMSEEAAPGWVKVQGRFWKNSDAYSVEWCLRSQNYAQVLRPGSVSSGWVYTGSLRLALKRSLRYWMADHSSEAVRIQMRQT